MPNETRKEYLARVGAEEEALPSIKEQAAMFDREPTIEVPHVRCPLCGLTAPEKRRELKSGKIVGVGGGPYHPLARLQKYGGTVPSPDGRMRTRPGLLWWDPEREIAEEQREELIKSMEIAIEFLRDGG